MNADKMYAKKYAGKTIENISPTEAGKRGYLLPEDVRYCNEWIAANFEQRQFKTIVYVDGVYKGVAEISWPLFRIVEKFKIS